jgi:phytoene dehydrogenase-like protein
MNARDIEALDRVSMHEFVTRYTQTPYVYLAFNFLLGLYFILPPKDVSAGEAVYCFQVMARDFALSYPMGGASAIPLAYIRGAERFGAQARTRARARRILIESGRVGGIVLTDGEVIRAPVVVSTTSLKDSVYRLTGPQHFSSDFRSRVDGLRGSQIAVQAKIALRRPLVNAAVLIGATPMHFGPQGPDIQLIDRNFGAFFSGRVPEVTPIYCPIPTYFDPSLAPPGHQLLTACALAPTTDISLEDEADKWRDAMMNALRQMVPGLDRETIFCDTFSVRYMERWLGKTGGAAVTTAQRIGQVGADRPCVDSEVPGLYFAGDCAGGRGVGTELAATSGMECADRILEDDRDLKFPLAS